LLRGGGGGGEDDLTWYAAIVWNRNKYRDAILLMLEEGEDNTVLGAMALLYALLRNPSIDKPILQVRRLFLRHLHSRTHSSSPLFPSACRRQVSNLYPLRMSKAKQLLDALTAISPRQDGIDSPSLPFDSPEKHKVTHTSPSHPHCPWQAANTHI
jgi:hypothetical protein